MSYFCTISSAVAPRLNARDYQVKRNARTADAVHAVDIFDQWNFVNDRGHIQIVAQGRLWRQGLARQRTIVVRSPYCRFLGDLWEKTRTILGP
jgi:hypothetical protein